MKKLLLLIGLLSSMGSLPCWATWTCAQGGPTCTVTATRSCTSGATCNITVTSTHAHAVEVACFNAVTTTFTFTVSGDGTWTTPVASHGTDTAGGSVECAYNLDATGGATTITCTFSTGQSSNQCLFLEFTGTGSSVTFDVASAADRTGSSTTQAGIGLALTTSNNYILIQASGCGATCSAINQSYNGIVLNGDGMAFKINVTSAGTTPNWTQSPASTMAVAGLAIYEVTGGGAGSSTMPPVIY